LKYRDFSSRIGRCYLLTVSGCKFLLSSTMAGSGPGQPVSGVEMSNRSNSGGNFPPPGAAMANGKPTGPPPRVQDCGLISSGSPTKYVCNGKVYTTFDLFRMRIAWEKKQAAGLQQ